MNASVRNLEVNIALDGLQEIVAEGLRDEFLQTLGTKLEAAYPKANPWVRTANQSRDTFSFRLRGEMNNAEYANRWGDEDEEIRALIKQAYEETLQRVNPRKNDESNENLKNHSQTCS